jgi:hypothetical protein
MHKRNENFPFQGKQNSFERNFLVFFAHIRKISRVPCKEVLLRYNKIQAKTIFESGIERVFVGKMSAKSEQFDINFI